MNASAGTGASGASGAALNWTVLLLLVVIWGSAFAAIRIGVETITPVWMVAGRLIAGTAFLGLWLMAERLLPPRRPAQTPPRDPVNRRAILWYGVTGALFTALPFVCFAYAEQTISSAAASICNGGTPFFTALLAHAVVPGERLTARRLVGIAMGFAGLVVLVAPDLAHGSGGSGAGLVIAILGASLYAGSNVGARIGPRLSPVMSSFLIVAGGAVASLVAALLLEPIPAAPSLASIAATLFLAFLPTGFAFILWVWLIHRAGSVFVTFTTYLSPLWAAGLGVVFLHEQIHWSMAAALALILAGVAVANWRARRRA